MKTINFTIKKLRQNFDDLTIYLILLLAFGSFSVFGQWSGTGDIYYNSGKVGIGISTPQYLLHLNEAATTGTTQSLLNLHYAPTDNYGSATIQLSAGANANALAIFEQVSAGGGNLGANQDYYDLNIKQVYSGTSAIGNINLFTGGLNRFTIIGGTGSTGGYVGIGTTSPTTDLDVNGIIRASTNLQSNVIRSDNNDFLLGITNNEIRMGSGNVNHYLSFYSGGSERFHIGTNGHVGIGTSAPQDELHILGNMIVDDLRDIRLDSRGGHITYNADPGGWAMGTYVKGSSGTEYGGFGFQGSADVLNNYFIGKYTDKKVTILSNGNVGIGTETPSNVQNWNRVLDVYGATGSKILATTGTSDVKTGVFSHNSWGGSPVGIIGTESAHNLIISAGYGNDHMMLTTAGDFGIGTLSPSSKLEVSADVNDDALITVSNSNSGNLARRGISLGNGTAGNAMNVFSTSSTYNSVGSWQNSGVIGTDSGLLNGMAFFTTTGKIRFQPGGAVDKIVFDENGHVGIGTTDPGTYKLAVEGQIGTRSIKVTTAAWADYVFAPEYKLMNLNATEEFIKENGHLPNIPSAEDVKENGFVLEAMDAKLLEKIEELTLHLIEQNKKLEKQQKEIEHLRKLVNQ